ncbi:hypothetical protein D3C73_1316890 [compost metagenome]
MIPYLKISHYGSSPVITDCSILIRFSFEKSGIINNEILELFLGTIEKDIEVFIPLTPLELERKTYIDMESIIFNYTTLKGERLRFVRDYEMEKEHLERVSLRSDDGFIYRNSLKTANWIYPNKIDNTIFRT